VEDVIFQAMQKDRKTLLTNAGVLCAFERVGNIEPGSTTAANVFFEMEDCPYPLHIQATAK
jgi:hypothetical protein